MWFLTLLVGLVAGVGFALLYPRPEDGAGPGLVRGAMYGFLAWIVAPLSVLPALDASGLPWAVEEVREAFPGLPGYILFGAALSVFYHWLGAVGRLLFSDTVPGGDDEGIGTQGLRALARGVLAGFVGGLAFTGVMVQTGSLGGVADLVDATSTVAGFFVHLAIAIIVGASYGLLFRRQSFDIGSALGWGCHLRVHLVGSGLADSHARLSWHHAGLGRRCSGRGLSPPDRAYDVRGSSWDYLLSFGGPSQPLVDSAKRGGDGAGGQAQGAGADLGSGPLDAGGRHLVDPARASRDRRPSRRSRLDILTGPTGAKSGGFRHEDDRRAVRSERDVIKAYVQVGEG